MWCSEYPVAIVSSQPRPAYYALEFNTHRPPHSSPSSLLPLLPPSPSPPILTLTSTTLNTVNRILLLTVFVCRCLLFVFSTTRIGSPSTPTTRARHTKSRSSTHGLPRYVYSRDPRLEARVSRSSVPGMAWGMWKGRRRRSPSVRR